MSAAGAYQKKKSDAIQFRRDNNFSSGEMKKRKQNKHFSHFCFLNW